MMNGNGHTRKELRRLRRRLDALERGIYETDQLIQYTRRSDEPGKEDRIANYHIENQERQEELDEILYVLDQIDQRRQRAAWSLELKLTLFLLSVVVVMLALTAIVRTF